MAYLTALAGVLILLAVPITIFILLELHDLHWSLGGVLAISGGMHFALSVAVLWGAIQAFRFNLETGSGLIGAGIASLALGYPFLGGIAALVAGILLLIAGGLTFAS